MRKLIQLDSAPRGHWVGDGFPVRSMFSTHSHGQHVSPFVMLDYAGPAKFNAADRKRGVGVHPHRGFETVTIVYEGEVDHRDSAGNSGHIGPGDVQWMTAASGVLHEEFHSEAFTRNGGVLEMIQLWVNLPAKDKMKAPAYQPITNADIPSVALPDGAGTVRVIAGAFDGVAGPANTHTPMDVWDVRLKTGGKASLTLPEGHTAMIVVLKGTVEFNGEHLAREAQLALFAREGGAITVEANGEATLLVLSGEPINEPVVAHGPFVMNTEAEIHQAMVDYRDGKFGSLAA